MVNSHDTAIELAKFLSLLKTSMVERYQLFYNKSGGNCKYTRKALLLFERRDKDKLLKALKALYKRLEIR
jgi:CRISPR/Cas system endoribonuclease Cas6 (RAMP superfamily)